uniref:Uncharacterized protein n=1 Tax=Rhizophora mucronata TaxID=61149 RepID=A0A2P2QDQ3_RHIMU
MKIYNSYTIFSVNFLIKDFKYVK